MRKQNSKATVWWIVAIVALCWAGPSFAQTTLKAGDKLDAVVAIVGHRPIYKSSIDAQVQLILMQHPGDQLSADSLTHLREAILQSEIDHKVLLAAADHDSIVVTDQEVDQQLDDQIQSWVDRLGSKEAVQKQLGKTVEELKTSPELRQRTKEQILESRERQKVVPTTTTISRQDVEEFYKLYRDSLPMISEEVELATIVKLAKTLPNQRERSKAFAEQLLDSLHHGADFATLAKRYSQGSNAQQGGDFGSFVPRGAFVPAFEEAAFKLKPGEISDVVSTDQGFYIIKLLERRGEEIHVAQILIKPTVNMQDKFAVRDSLMRLRDSALAGADFATLARKYSDDPETSAFGGALGKIRLTDLAGAQRDVVDSLEPGQISMPVPITYPNGEAGYQIVKLIMKIPAHAVSVNEDYHDLEATASQWKQMRDFQQWLQQERSKVYIDVHNLASYY